MGKSVELLGLVTFNIFLAMVLSTTFLSSGSNGAIFDSLTEDYVEKFIHETNEISNGLREGMDSYSITNYFMDHVADDGEFENTVRMDIAQADGTERTQQMGKLDFISHVLKAMQSGGTEDRESTINIENISIMEDGRAALVMTSSQEKGMMPYDDGSGEQQMIPVVGHSYCEQKIVLSDKRIQMKNAKCTTSVSYDSF